MVAIFELFILYILIIFQYCFIILTLVWLFLSKKTQFWIQNVATLGKKAWNRNIKGSHFFSKMDQSWILTLKYALNFVQKMRRVLIASVQRSGNPRWRHMLQMKQILPHTTEREWLNPRTGGEWIANFGGKATSVATS